MTEVTLPPSKLVYQPSSGQVLPRSVHQAEVEHANGFFLGYLVPKRVSIYTEDEVQAIINAPTKEH